MDNLLGSILIFCLLAQALSVPVQKTVQTDDFCSGESLYKYENDKEYMYDYETDTTLWINDVSDDAKSVLTLKSTVYITPIGQCTYLLRMEESNLNGESLNQRDSSSVLSQLNNYNAVFRLNQQGELETEVKFQPEDKQWSRNIKRAIISAFQVKSESNLRSLDHLNEPNEKSATVYETDILGRCRTTYKLEENTNRVKLNKMKSLQRCTLNENSKTSALQFVPYKTLPEFFQGRLFIEDYECNSIIENNLLESVVCKEVSTYKIGSRGRLGAQAIVNQRLSFRRQSSSSRSTPKTDSWETYNIQFEYDNTKQNELESADFDVTTFTQDICSKGKTQGLKNEHSDNFKDLVMTIKTYSTDELIRLYEQSNSRCELAGLTISQALLFADTEDSFEAVLSLMDKNAFDELRYITEYPLLTALARNQNPSEKLINKLKNYLSSKPESFPYMNKLYLIYSTLVKTYCNQNECSSSQLDNWSSLFSSNLVDDCTNNRKKELVVSSLKAIGNIGYFKNINMLANCAVNKDNSLEVRVNALQSLRRFKCEQMEQFDHTFSLLQDINQDSEIRINAFLSLIRCSDQSEKFKQFAENKLSDFLFNENDIQLLTYIIDYGKEHSLTNIINDPIIQSKLSMNIFGFSKYRYNNKYNLLEDSNMEYETSIIYAPKTSLPRSIRYNATFHWLGMSVNFIEVAIRVEGLESILKDVLLTRLFSQDYIKNIMKTPEQFVEILKALLEKIKNSNENPEVSISIRLFGLDVFYSHLNNPEKFQSLYEFLNFSRENLENTLMLARNYLYTEKYKQPLLNGFEFSASSEVNLGILLSKSSTQELDFEINNLYSSVFGVTHKYDVKINNENKISFKNKIQGNGRFSLDIVKGTKEDGTHYFNFNILPNENITLFSLNGNLMKLKNDLNYEKVVSLKNEKLNGCSNFQNTFGLNLCISTQKSLNSPYYLKLWIRNPEMIKTITAEASLRKQLGKFNFFASVSTISDLATERRLQFNYSRESKLRNGALINTMKTMLSLPKSDKKLTVNGEVNYRKNMLLQADFVLNNTLIKEFKVKLQFSRAVLNLQDLITDYSLDASVQFAEEAPLNLEFKAQPDGNNVHSYLKIQQDDLRLLKVLFDLKNNQTNDWSLEFVALRTDPIPDLSLRADLSLPFQRSSAIAEFKLFVPSLYIDSKTKAILNFDKLDKKLNFLEIKTAKFDQEPSIIFYERKFYKNTDLMSVYYSFGFRKFDIDLASFDNENDHENSILRDFVVNFKATAMIPYGRLYSLDIQRNEKKIFQLGYNLDNRILNAFVTTFDNIANFTATVIPDQEAKIELFSEIISNKHNLTGVVKRDMLKSEIEFLFYYSSPRFFLTKPATLKLNYDLFNASPFAQIHLELPDTPINHGLKLLKTIEYIGDNKSIKKIELELIRPEYVLPETLFYQEIVEVDMMSKTTEYSVGVRNTEIFLMNRRISFVQDLISVDDEDLVKSFVISFRNQIHQKDTNQKLCLNFNKNEKPFIALHLGLSSENEDSKINKNYVDHQSNKLLAMDFSAKYLKKFIQGNSSLDLIAEGSKVIVEFALDGETSRPDILKLSGDLKGSNEKSEIDLSLEYSSLEFSLSRPAKIEFSHSLGEQNEFEIHFDLPETVIKHGLKLKFNNALSTIIVQLQRPDKYDAETFFYEKTKIDNYLNKISFGLINLEKSLPSFLTHQSEHRINSLVCTVLEKANYVSVTLIENGFQIGSLKWESSLVSKNSKQTADFGIFLNVLDKNANLTGQLITIETTNDINYNLFIKGSSCSGHNMNLNAKIFGNIEESNIKSTFSYSNREFSLPRPAIFKFSHFYTNDKIMGELDLDLPNTNINHGLKLSLDFTENMLTKAQMILQKPNRNLPEVLFYERITSQTDTKSIMKYRFGFNNLKINLSKFENKFAKELFQLDNNDLKSCLVILTKEVESTGRNYIVVVSKNEKEFFETMIGYNSMLVNLNTNVYLKYFKHYANMTIKYKEITANDKQIIELRLNADTSRNDKFELKTKRKMNLIDYKFDRFTSNLYLYVINTNVDHHLNIHVGSDDTEEIVAKLNIQLQRPNRNVPETLFYELRDSSRIENRDNLLPLSRKITSKYGLKNFDIDLTNSGSFLAKFFNNKFESIVSEVEMNIIFGATVQSNSSFRRNGQIFLTEYLEHAKLRNEFKYKYNTFDIENTNSSIIFDKYNSKNGINFYIKFQHDSDNSNNLNFESRLVADTYKSNITIKMDYSNAENAQLNWPRPASFKFSHQVDNSQTNAIIQLDLPNTPINNLIEITTNDKFNNIKIELTSLRSFYPYSILFTRNFILNDSNTITQTMIGFINIRYFYDSRSKMGDLKFIKFISNSDMTSRTKYLKLNIQQNLLSPRVFQGVDTYDCNYIVELENEVIQSGYLIQAHCQNTMLFKNRLLRIQDNDTDKLELNFESKNIQPKLIRIFYKKFTEENGLFNLTIVSSDEGEEEKRFSEEFSYLRVYDHSQNKFNKANYQFKSFINLFMSSYISEKCDLIINSKTDYLNSLKCILDSPRMSNKPVNFGYNLRLDKPIVNDRRDASLEVEFNDRILKTELKANLIDSANYNVSTSFYWDLKKDQTKFLTINLMRQAFDPRRIVYSTEVLNFPLTKSIKMQIDNQKTFNQTSMLSFITYELNNGNKNRLDFNLKRSTSLNFNQYSFETNLQRPSLNIHNTYKYDKFNGGLKNLNLRFGKLIKLNIDNESEQRKVSIEFVNPDETQYNYERTEKFIRSKYIVTGILSKSSQQISKIVSTFDSNNNNLDVKITGLKTGASYRLDFGIFNEKLANVYVFNENDHSVLSLASLDTRQIAEDKNLVLSIKWNTFWKQMKNDILAIENLENEANFKTYFYDIYSELYLKDINPSLELLNKEKSLVLRDIEKFYSMFNTNNDFDLDDDEENEHEDENDDEYEFEEINLVNGNTITIGTSDLDENDDLDENNQDSEENEERLSPVACKFERYNNLANRIAVLKVKTEKYYKKLSDIIPNLPIIEYNKQETNQLINQLLVYKPIEFAENLYQYYAEFRNYARQLKN